MKILVSLYLVLAVILAQYFAAYFFSKGRTTYRKAFSALVLCISIYLFGYIMIIHSSDMQEIIFWNQFQYFGLPFISVLWLVVALLHTETIYSLTTRMTILLFSVPITSFLMRLTNHWHHLFYARYEMREIAGYYSLYMERGLWYYVNISYTILCLLLTVMVYFIGYRKNRANHTKSHFFIFLFASLLPLFGIGLVLTAYDELSIDYSALIMPVSLLIISYGIFQYDFLEIKTLARDAIFEKNLAGMVVLGPGKRIIDYNQAAEKFFTAMNISLDNYPIDHLLSKDRKLLEIFQSETNQDFAVTINGEERFFEIDVVPLGEHHDGNTRLLKSIRDVTEERRVQEKLRFLATTDSLSGLNNRAEFMSLAQRQFTSAKKNNEELSLLIMDLDHFKAVNDTFGHGAGDEIIREMGRIIKSSFRKTDIAGRIGGEEFAVVLQNASLKDAKRIAEQFRETVAKRKVVYEEREIGFTVSIGVAAIRSGTGGINHVTDMIKIADDALYKAKAKGRNCVVSME